MTLTQLSLVEFGEELVLEMNTGDGAPILAGAAIPIAAWNEHWESAESRFALYRQALAAARQYVGGAERATHVRLEQRDDGLVMAHFYKAPTAKIHHTLGGNVLRIGELKKPKPRTLLDWLRDVFMAW